jgi:hypothetical protein
VLMMWASKVSRSTMAAHSRGSVKAAVHSLKAALEAIAMEARSSRSVKDLEQQLGAAAVQLEVAQLVQAEQVDASADRIVRVWDQNEGTQQQLYEGNTERVSTVIVGRIDSLPVIVSGGENETVRA